MNRLHHTTSPYLRQHADNPVDWWPWNNEAIAKARAENKPIFLSVGYSTCHWCHVMAHESFEDTGTAALLNDFFICIKLDREERPDIDHLYMTALQAMTGSGGWPMSLWLTPDLEPFYCATYIPRDMFRQICRRIHELWDARPAEVRQQAGAITEALRSYLSTGRAGPTARPLDDNLIHNAIEHYRAAHDSVHGGFGSAPKFPQPSALNFLFRCGGREMALHQLRAMAEGGIHDQLGGGFHRYSTDERWLVPHFEKMLYDQAQLIISYTEAWQITGDLYYQDIARRTADYVLRDLTSSVGAFYAAEDADSEGIEGKFYTWTCDELKSLLGVNTHAFTRAHGGEVLFGKMAEPERSLLFAARNRRSRPHRDEKIITSWNGLMISALARLVDPSGSALGAAIRSADYLIDRGPCRTETVPGLLDDYANLGIALLDLYEATLEPRWLRKSISCADQMLGLFYDSQNGGFFQTTDPVVIVRAKDSHDGAEPSGNAQAALLLLRLAPHGDRERYRAAAQKTLALFGGMLNDAPQAAPQLLCALDLALREPVEITFTGDDVGRLLAVVHEQYLPNRVIRHQHGSTPFAQICANRACHAPVSDPDELRKQLLTVSRKVSNGLAA